MDFNLSEEDLELKQMARELAEKRIYPRALEMDEKGETPADLIKECAENGYFGITVPEAYGGMELSSATFMGMLEEICAACAGFGIMLSVHNSLTCEILKLFGSEELKQKYLPAMAAGEKIGAYCITEPNAGTDIASLSTTAVEKGDHWLLNGTKTFVTNAGYAGVFIVFAKTHPDEGRKGISCFVVDKDAEGLTIGKPEMKCGIKASDTREINLQDVAVPKVNLVGNLKDGFKQPSSIPKSASSSISRSPTSRRSSSRWRRWPPVSMPVVSSPIVRRSSRTLEFAVIGNPPWPSCSVRRWPISSPTRRCKSTGATAISRSMRSNAISAMPG
jgi:butyryl-CoA dehydrogenase